MFLVFPSCDGKAQTEKLVELNGRNGLLCNQNTNNYQGKKMPMAKPLIISKAGLLFCNVYTLLLPAAHSKR